MKLTVAIDDLHPEKGWGLEGDECMFYLEELNKEFGVKFTLFIPSNYHNKFPLSQHKYWIDWLLSKDYFELAAHGHYHMTSDKQAWGECEFADMQTVEICKERISLMINEWESVNYKPKGWRNPGWLCQPFCVNPLSETFEYAAVHYEHNRGMNWSCKMLFGHDGIHETDIKLHNDVLMFQSHIAGDWNQNVWNKDNYEQFRSSLQFISDNYSIEPLFLKEL
jgi:hypothetical protein